MTHNLSLGGPVAPESPERIGMVLGTEDATPTIFWFAVSAGASVQLDDLVVVADPQAQRPAGPLLRRGGQCPQAPRGRHLRVGRGGHRGRGAARLGELRRPGAGDPCGPGGLHSAAAGRRGAPRARQGAGDGPQRRQDGGGRLPGGLDRRRAGAAAQLPLHQRRIRRPHQYLRHFRRRHQNQLRSVFAALDLPQRRDGQSGPEKRRAAGRFGGRQGHHLQRQGRGPAVSGQAQQQGRGPRGQGPPHQGPERRPLQPPGVADVALSRRAVPGPAACRCGRARPSCRMSTSAPRA